MKKINQNQKENKMNLVKFTFVGKFSHSGEINIYINPPKVSSLVQWEDNVVRIYFENFYHDVNGCVDEVAKKLGYVNSNLNKGE